MPLSDGVLTQPARPGRRAFQKVGAFGGEDRAGPFRSLGAQDVRGTEHPQEAPVGKPRVERGEAGIGVTMGFPWLECTSGANTAGFPVPADDRPVRAEAEETGAEAAPDHFLNACVQAGSVTVATARVEIGATWFPYWA